MYLQTSINAQFNLMQGFESCISSDLLKNKDVKIKGEIYYMF